MNDVLNILYQIFHINQDLHGEEYLKVFVKNIAKELDIKCVFIGHSIGNEKEQVQTDVVWTDDKYFENFIYDLKYTPCENVLSGKRVCIHSANVCKIFEKDTLLKDMGVESYVGSPVMNFGNNISGLLVLLDNKPMKNEEFYKTITEILAMRASAELEKIYIEENLKREVNARTKELRKTQEELMKAEKLASLGTLVAGVAHEINTPIGISLTGATHLQYITENIKKLYADNNLSEEEFEGYITSAGELTSSIFMSLTKAVSLIKNFKQVAVDQSRELKREFYIYKYINEILLNLKNRTKKNNITVNVECAKDLFIYSYPNEFAQIITNLIINSLDHGYEYKEQGDININVTEENNHIVIVYNDDGKGISTENLKHIYEPFFTTRRKDGNTGLGMQIIYNIITMKLNGKIECTSEENHGVEFRIIFPIEKRR